MRDSDDEKNNMKISKLNEWLTLISNLAVLIGIGFIWFELNQNEQIIRAQMSQERANRIRRYLITNGVDPGRITSVTGHGEQRGVTYPKARKTEVRIMESSNRR